MVVIRQPAFKSWVAKVWRSWCGVTLTPARSPAAYRGGDTYHLGAFGLTPNTTAAVTLSVAGYASTADPPVVCPVMVELATGNMATADVNENGQADDCFVGDYDALLTLPMPTQPTAPYGWYGAYVTFPTDAPDYEGPADQGGIWGVLVVQR